MTKLLQVYHIHNNSKLFDSETNKRVECRALNITEELGQVGFPIAVHDADDLIPLITVNFYWDKFISKGKLKLYLKENVMPLHGFLPSLQFFSVPTCDVQINCIKTKFPLLDWLRNNFFSLSVA